MDKTEWIWIDGKFVKWEDANIHILSHALHYGSGAFEGIRFYKTAKGPAIFRAKEHYERMEKSSAVLRIKYPYSADDLVKATAEAIKKNRIDQGYIRPIAFYGYGKMGLNPSGCAVHTAIAVWPWGAYLSEDPVKIKISKYIRIHPKSLVSDAKICGHYVNSILAGLEAKDAGFDEALLLDYRGNVAEGPGENFFIVKDNVLITPPLGNILPGITRNSIMTVARDLGYKVEEKEITAEQAKAADECFFTGTAAEVTPVKMIDDASIANSFGPVTKKLKDTFLDIVHGKNEKYQHWLTYV